MIIYRKFTGMLAFHMCLTNILIIPVDVFSFKEFSLFRFREAFDLS